MFHFQGAFYPESNYPAAMERDVAGRRQISSKMAQLSPAGSAPPHALEESAWLDDLRLGLQVQVQVATPEPPIRRPFQLTQGRAKPLCCIMGSIPEEKTPIDVAIIGGGIGGLALSIGLQQYSHIRVRIFEAAPMFYEIGGEVVRINL
ncbi:hypothetical protein NQ176_g8986 [Zarea fungicola]|uniref:Uncharacterized protein n=1 Tax=Zarea fungicola TaxID=93591 RepID=A0ACC1MQ54_9HYPO|nr:hypothetical protein NQ176_g8986 [Lecanicillium fungicola]